MNPNEHDQHEQKKTSSCLYMCLHAKHLCRDTLKNHITKNTIRETGVYGSHIPETINTRFPDRVFGYVIY